MSTVSFKRSANVNEIPIVDGQLVFDETHNKIYMDNGAERLQYGGDVSLIEDISYATSNNTFSANGSLDIFTQKLSVIDNKDSALAATEQHVPVGCLAFQSVIGNADYSGVGNTVSDSLITLKNGIVGINGQLTVNNEQFYFDYQNGKYGYNTSPTRGADTFNPFNEGLHRVVLGRWNTYNIKNLYPDIYAELTNDNFILQCTGITANFFDYPSTVSSNCGISYNATTGILSMTGSPSVSYTSQLGTASAGAYVQVVMFY